MFLQLSDILLELTLQPCCNFIHCCYSLLHHSLKILGCKVMFLTIFISQERQRVIYEEQKKLAQHQAQTKSQMARYEDELARKRMQACNFTSTFYYYLTLGTLILSNNLRCVSCYRLRMRPREQEIKNL